MGIYIYVDCKTIGFFPSKSEKKSVKRGVRVLRAQSEAREKVFLASLSSLALCFQPRSRSFVWLLARRYLNTQKYELFCSLIFILLMRESACQKKLMLAYL